MDDCQIPLADELPIETEIKNAANRAREYLADEQLLWLLEIAEIALQRGCIDEEARDELELREEDVSELREELARALGRASHDVRFSA